ncbi:MAG: monooxygenase [Candidatus Hydrogenedentota bacterium]
METALDAVPETAEQALGELALAGVVIVGAGPSGLAMAACLKRLNVPHVVIERHAAAGASWRNHYDRLHLHTVKEHSALPYLPFPKSYPRYPSRDQVAAYLEDYERHFGLRVRYNEEVTGISKTKTGWQTRTTQSEVHSRCVVIASGYNRRPYVPTWPGIEEFEGLRMHSSEYRNGAAFKGGRVLVVGLGNTGGEIAMDLHEHGAKPVICVRGPVNVVPRDYLGTPMQVFGLFCSHLPRQVSNALQRTIQSIAIGDLSQWGIERPNISPADHVNQIGRVPLVDIGMVALIKQGKIGVVPAIERFTRSGIVCGDGSEHPFDSVILATGFRPNLHEFLDRANEVTDERGYPIPPAGESKFAGLYFLGYCNPSTGLLRQINLDAKQIAANIAAKSGR